MHYLFLMMFFGNSVYAASISLDPDQKQKVQILSYKDVRVSQIICEKTCEAKKMVDGPVDVKKIEVPKKNPHNPSSYFCRGIGGVPGIGHMEDGAEISICTMKDKSFFVSWDLLKKL
jgi:putative hemolysin